MSFHTRDGRMTLLSLTFLALIHLSYSHTASRTDNSAGGHSDMHVSPSNRDNGIITEIDNIINSISNNSRYPSPRRRLPVLVNDRDENREGPGTILPGSNKRHNVSIASSEGSMMPSSPTREGSMHDNIVPNEPSNGVNYNDHGHNHGSHEEFPGANSEGAELGVNIERFDESTILNSTTNAGIPGGLTPRTSIPEDYEICNMCLCKNDHTGISCQGDILNGIRDLTLEASLIPLVAKYIIVTGYNKVTIKNGTFADPQQKLLYIELEDIKNLVLEENSLYFSQMSQRNKEVRIIIKNCEMKVIPSYTLTQLLADNTQHEEATNVLAPEDTRYLTLEICRCKIGEMQSKAFYLARMLYFNLTDTIIGKLSEKSIDLYIYEEWMVQDSRLPTIPTNSICIHAKKSVVFARNVITKLEPYAWSIVAAGQVLFDYNNVGTIQGLAFQNITPQHGSWVANIVFVNNTVSVAEPDSLVTSDLYPRHERKVLDNKFDIVCQCNISDVFKELLDIRKDDNSDQQLHIAVIMNSMCKPNPKIQRYQPIHRYIRQECVEVPLMMILLGVLLALAFVMSIAVAIVCARRAKRAEEEVSYMGECSSRSFSTINTHPAPLSPGLCLDKKNIYYDSAGNPSWIVAVPEVKTYQETEVHFTYEESEPIRNSTRGSYVSNNMLELQPPNNRSLATRQSCPFN